MQANNRRIAERKAVEGIEINDLTSITNYSVIAREGKIINASSTGFLVEIERRWLVPEELRDNLSLQATIGQAVVLYLPQMNLDLDGTIMRATHTGKGRFLVAIDFAADVPDYWRNCLVDLLPAPGELDEAPTTK
ncbi:MAG: hypothetical protein KDD38_06380 [Bdellovibrionales bacterium]|nr:hypothetical protein [Bdellovibrionales bacterium]